MKISLNRIFLKFNFTYRDRKLAPYLNNKDFCSRPQKTTKSIKAKFITLNPRNFKTRNIFIVGNILSRRFRRCRIRICNNPKFSFLKGGGGGCESLTRKIPIEGVGMGLPLGPTLANIFMCHFETLWINSCPAQFKPVVYKRYIDDTFILFRNPTHSQLFSTT